MNLTDIEDLVDDTCRIASAFNIVANCVGLASFDDQELSEGLLAISDALCDKLGEIKSAINNLKENKK